MHVRPRLCAALALALAAGSSAAPVQRPFAVPGLARLAAAVAGALGDHNANTPDPAHFASRGAGIPVLHDLCSEHALVASERAAAADVYVYHGAAGWCVTLFAAEGGASEELEITAAPAQEEDEDADAADAASWTGTGNMPGSLRIRGDADCVRVRASVGGRQQAAFETCLHRRDDVEP